MENPAEEPRRVTPSEARSKLLRTLITPPKPNDREKTDKARADFITDLIQSDAPERYR